MPLPKQTIPINFAQGLNQKSDPKQLQPGKFLELENSIFTKGGLLQKRNGFPRLASLPDSSSKYLSTFNGNLTAIGEKFEAYSAGSETWSDKGNFQPLNLKTLSVYRSGTNQIQCDAVTAPNGLTCIAFIDQIDPNLFDPWVIRYVIVDSITGQNIIPPTNISSLGSPRIFLLGSHFVLVYARSSSALCYIAININNPTSVTAQTDITTVFSGNDCVFFDGFVANNNLYLSYNASDGGGAIRTTYLDSTLTQHNTVVIASKLAEIVTVTADLTTGTPIIYVSFWATTQGGYTAAYNQILGVVFTPKQIITSGTILNLISTAQNGLCTLVYEFDNNYSYDSSIPTHFLNTRTVTQAGTVNTASQNALSIGLSSKAFLIDEIVYFVGVYQSPFQSTYFVCNVIDGISQVVASLAYGNAHGYQIHGLSSVSVDGSVAQFPYLRKDFTAAVSKANAAVNNTSGIYSQSGIHLATLDFDPSSLAITEIGSNLNLSGGFLWAYDGFEVAEQNFFLYPDSIKAVWSASGGSMVAKPDGLTNTSAYYYSVTYEWTDNQGNLFRSAPSIPVAVTTTGSGTSGSVTVNIPNIRLTYKQSSIKMVIYRWSVGQQSYYQTTSVSSPLLNDPTVDSVAYIDKNADASILGNTLLYTTGGVIENIPAPANNIQTLYKSRLFLVDAEDDNLLWYSKELIENTPVEMSDLFTVFSSPTISAHGSTGGIKALSALDDKLIIFKKNAIYYLVGNGPDNTGANNDFSDPVFITSTVGCSNPSSIVFIPQGLMFQSDKGIWLLGRDLSTSYIGADVENFNNDLVLNSLTIPGTNEVRFTLTSGYTLLYDYFYNQWGSFKGNPAISSTLFENLNTSLNQFGQVFQESPDIYLDGSNPVLMRFKTGWFNLAGLQGFERAYFFYLVGDYLSPHKLQIQIAYDYNPNPSQQVIITPGNTNTTYGSEAVYGSGSPYGGSQSLEQWRIFFNRQKCQAFQITIQEIYDPSLGVAAGPGLTLSGLAMVVGMKGTYPRLSAAQTANASS